MQRTLDPCPTSLMHRTALPSSSPLDPLLPSTPPISPFTRLGACSGLAVPFHEAREGTEFPFPTTTNATTQPTATDPPQTRQTPSSLPTTTTNGTLGRRLLLLPEKRGKEKTREGKEGSNQPRDFANGTQHANQGGDRRRGVGVTRAAPSQRSTIANVKPPPLGGQGRREWMGKGKNRIRRRA